MHGLFAEVLSNKDLSRAGELFLLEDATIEDDLVDIVEQIRKIADTEEYETSDNNQSVVEICITRITTAIRESDRIEQYAGPLVELLSMCLRHNLTPKVKDEDPPHAKIASDVMSRLFSYYGNEKVMTLAIPAVVQFLDCDNKDLVRSVASYLSLATIDNSDLLARHMLLILSSVLKGNYLLGQILPQIYEQNPQPVLDRVDELVELLGHCDTSEKVCFLQVLNKVAKTHSKLLENHVPLMCSFLSSSQLSLAVLTIFVEMAMSQPATLVDNLPHIQAVEESQPLLMFQISQITGAVGTVSEEHARKSMNFLVAKLASVDQSVIPSLLQEIRTLGVRHHSLLMEHLEHISKLSSSGSGTVRHLIQQIREDVRKYTSITSPGRKQSISSDTTSHSSKTVPVDATRERPRDLKSVGSQTEGTVTVITVGNPTEHVTQSRGNVSVQTPILPPSSASSQHSLVKLHRRASLPPEHRHSLVRVQTPETVSVASVGTCTDFVHIAESVRDGVQLFCEKHFVKIKNFILKLNANVPLPVKCSVVSGKHKRYLKLHFECANQSAQCLYSRSHFIVNTRLPKLWVHLMFLSVQARSRCALSQRDPNISCLKVCWDALKGDTTNSFLTLVTSSFPSQKDQLALLQELHQMRYFDVFELNAAKEHWACFVCNHPEKLSELLNDGYPEIAGQLKEKKGKWKFFKRWKTRYFTLSGGSITYDKSNSTKATLPITKIQSVKAVRKGIRDTPKAFEIFTGDQTYRFKAKGHQNVEQWVQCLHIAVALSHNIRAPFSGNFARSVNLVAGWNNGKEPTGRTNSRTAAGNISAFSGFTSSQPSTNVIGNPRATRRVILDTKL